MRKLGELAAEALGDVRGRGLRPEEPARVSFSIPITS